MGGQASRTKSGLSTPMGASLVQWMSTNVDQTRLVKTFFALVGSRFTRVEPSTRQVELSSALVRPPLGLVKPNSALVRALLALVELSSALVRPC